MAAELATLKAMIADLDGYIDRRAHDVAVPLVAQAESVAMTCVLEVQNQLGEARFDAQRWKDCNTELGRRLAARDQLRTRIADLTVAVPLPDDNDVHVDWHMTPEEWAELREVLTGGLDAEDSQYIRRLRAEGKLDA
jgi:hypothetical protein